MKIYSLGGRAFGLHALGRLGGKKKEIFVLSFVQHQSGFDLVPGKPVPEDEIPVASGMFAGVQFDVCGAFVLKGNGCLVGRAAHLLDGNSAAHPGLDVERIWRGLTFVQIGVLGPFLRSRGRGGRPV